MVKLGQGGRLAGLALAAVAAVFLIWTFSNNDALPEGFALGNGRIEAVEIDVAASSSARIDEILVKEGEFVEAGQELVRMDIRQLTASLNQVAAQLQQAEISVENARLLVKQRNAEKRAAEARLAQARANFDAAQRQFERAQRLATENVTSEQALDQARAEALGAEAAVAAAEASLAAAEAAIASAESSVVGAEAAVKAAQAAREAIEVQIEDSTLTAPRAGRVQYIVAREGEIVAAGGRVVNLVDVSDVFMTFFLPTADAGRTGIGTEARILLDAAPGIVIPAEISFVADVAQFTPKSVETQVEREKLMFRTRARIAPELLQKYLEQIKTGLPGVTWVRLDPQAPWPEDAQGQILQ